VIKKSCNLLASERTREPLHVILHEHLDRGAIDGATALNRHVHATADRHVGAEKNFGFRISDSGLIKLSL
jgi:hypothetical protein